MAEITLHGVIFPTDTINSNGRVYTKEVVEKAIKDYEALIKDNKISKDIGEIKHKDRAMNDEERVVLYTQALATWGVDPQVMMVMEETGEMLNALAKFDRGRANENDVITELADVWIMMEEMAVLFGWDEFQKEKERKLAKIKNKLEEK